MNIVIAGDGEVGFYLARSLAELDYDITVVDPHAELLKKLEQETDLLTIVGNATSPEVLEEANASEADMMLAVLKDENVNLVACVVAKHLGAKRTVARVSNTELLEGRNREMWRELGVDEMVCPERIAAKEITNLLKNTVTQEFFDFAGGLLTMNLIRLGKESPAVGKKRMELMDWNMRFVAVVRMGETIIPHAEFVFEEGDLAYIICKRGSLDELGEISGKDEVRVKRVMIAGGGRVGRFASLALENDMSVTLVDESAERCRSLSESLRKTLIINGDATDISLLKDEGLGGMDAYIAVTDNTETNVLTCLNAKRLGVKRTIALVENTGFINLSQEIGIDTIINKKLITASYIARFTVSGDAVSSKWLSGTNAEVIEFVVGKRAIATRKAIGEMGMPNGAVIGGVIRGRETILPTRDTQLQEGDKVVVFALPRTMKIVGKLF